MLNERRPSVILLAYNSLELTKQCLLALDKHTDVPYELVLVDNGSRDATGSYFAQYARRHGNRAIQVVRLRQNRGYAGGNNAGLRVAVGDPLVLLSNDVMVSAGWLRRLCEYFVAQPTVSLLGPLGSNVSGLQHVPGVHYTTDQGYELWARYIARGNKDKLVPTERLVGFCLAFRRSVYEEIGLLDKRFGQGTWEDDDFCRRARQVGFKLAVATDIYVHHLGSATLRAEGVDLVAQLDKNRRIYEEKWKTG